MNKKYTINYMTKAERRTIKVNCNWFSINTLNASVNLVYENDKSTTGESNINDLLSWSLVSYPSIESGSKK